MKVGTFTRGHGILLIVLLALGLTTYWIMENVTLEEVSYPSSLKGEAFTNELLAAQRLTEGLGVSAATEFGLKRPPAASPDHTVIVMPTLRRTFSPKERDGLLAWVAAGGNLVVLAHTIDGEGEAVDWLLTRIGVKQVWSRSAREAVRSKANEMAKVKARAAEKKQQRTDVEPEEDSPSEVDGGDGGGGEAAKPKSRIQRKREAELLAKLSKTIPGLLPRARCPQQREAGIMAPRIAERDGSAFACFDGDFHLETTREILWSLSSNSGVHALTVAEGRGRVTVLTDRDFMFNNALETADHADVLMAIIGLNDADRRPTRVIFVPREDVDNVVILTWRVAWAVLLVLLLWLALWLWRASSRFGPIVASAALARRSVAEHIRAVGEFLWRHKHQDTLWRAAHRVAERRVAKTMPVASFKDATSHENALARRTGVATPALIRVLGADAAAAAPTRAEFATTIAILEKIRKSL